MSTDILISVIIPTLNPGPDIDRCLESLRTQTFGQFEVCVLDGQSTDGTVEMVHAYIGKIGKELRCLSEPDLGVYDAMNKGISSSKGEWIYFLGADDVIHDPEVFADVAKFIATCDADIVYGDVINKSSGARYDGEFSLDRLLFQRNICHQAIFYRRSVFERLGGYNLRYPIWADWEFNIRCFRHPDICTLWMDRPIAVYNNKSGLSRGMKDPLFSKELPMILIRENARLERKLAKFTKSFRRWSFSRLFRWRN